MPSGPDPRAHATKPASTGPSKSPSTLPASLPRDFGYYVLMHEIARGGMGAVYLARTGGIVGIEKWCVLKLLRADLTGDSEYAKRFIDEARVVVTFSHRNICHVFDVGRTDGCYYLAMERVPGRDLRSVLARLEEMDRRLSTQLALHIACETLEALDYAHRLRDPASGEPLGIVHRDVSPANVMLSHEGEVKLIDFGLARSINKELKTEPGLVLGKAAYMAPEQMCGDPVDGRADQFSAAVVTYEALTRDRYYAGVEPTAIFSAATLGEFRPRAWDTLDPELRSILLRATDPQPNRRFDSCGALRDALAAYAHPRFPPSGMRELRGVMSELFPKDADEFRALLNALKQTTPAHAKSAFGPQSVTETIAMSPKSDPALRQAAVRAALKEPSRFLADQLPPPTVAEAGSGTIRLPASPGDSSTDSMPVAPAPSAPPFSPPAHTASPQRAPASTPDWHDLIPNAVHAPRGESGSMRLVSDTDPNRTAPMPLPTVSPPRRIAPIAIGIVVVVALLVLAWFATSLKG